MLFKSGIFSRSTAAIAEDENRDRRVRQRLVVRTKAGKVAYGFCLALNKNSDSFHLDLVDKANQSLNKSAMVNFADLKAVFYVKSFDGRFDPEKYKQDIPDDALPLVLQFEDGEIIPGFSTSSHWASEPRFYFIPEDKNNNNMGILVERSALSKVMTPEEYRRQQHDEYEVFMRMHANSDQSKQEVIGDFYFQNHNYFKALKHYREAREESPESPRIRKKLCATKYNVGVCHIRQHDYERALRFMELVLAMDPSHEQAMKRTRQLREHLSRAANRGHSSH